MNVYYDPAKFGLTIVGEVDGGGGYDFDKFVIWRDQTGRLLWADDSGCSCPSPFESVGIPDLASGTAHECAAALQAWAAEDADWRTRQGQDVVNLLAKVTA